MVLKTPVDREYIVCTRLYSVAALTAWGREL